MPIFHNFFYFLILEAHPWVADLNGSLGYHLLLLALKIVLYYYLYHKKKINQ